MRRGEEILRVANGTPRKQSAPAVDGERHQDYATIEDRLVQKAELEKRHAKPVFDSTLVTIWHALRLAGVDDDVLEG